MISEKSLKLRGQINCLTVKCPECRQEWLAPGLAGSDEHVCKRCGAAFVPAAVPDDPREPRELLRSPILPVAAETPA